jgi:hypothetical protein
MISKAINELIRELSGYVLQPGDSEYENAVKIDNGRIQLRPRLVVRPTVVEDVLLGFKFAITNNLPFTIKGGGHSATGYCLNDNGLVMDMKHLNKISFDKRKQSVTVGMGAIWRDVYEYMANSGTGLIPIGGGCPTVAPPGFMLGGGYSFVSRSYGMSIDSLLGMKIITPDGQLRSIGVDSKSKEDQDLFWACCGGGGGNFGIVVEMEIKVHKPYSEKMLVGQIRYPLEQAEEILGYYNDWVETIPNEMSVYGFIGQQPDPIDPSKKVKTIGLTPVFNGEYAKGIELLNGLLKLKPINTDLRHMTLPDWEFYNGNTTLVENRSAYIRSLILPKGGLNNKVAKVIIEYMNMAPSPDSFAVWTLTGGAISEKAPGDTAYVHRNARFVPEIKSIWDRDKPGDALVNVEWAYEFFEAMRVAGKATGAYVNYIDPLLHDWAKMYYGENYERLKAIKKHIDPKDLLNFQQSVGSSFNPPVPPLKDLSPLNRTQIIPKA